MKITIDRIHGEMMHAHKLEDIEDSDNRDEWYGISWQEGSTSPAFTRIGNLSLHNAVSGLPVQQLMKRCLVTAAGVVTYLYGSDSTRLADGSPADLSGAAGNVMVEIPEHYYKAWKNGDWNNYVVSMYPLSGFTKIEKHYISAYEASLNRTTSTAASVVNTTATYRGGANTSAWDATSKSLLGEPVTSLTKAQERAAAGLIGTGWCEEPFQFWSPWRWLAYIEYATRDLQQAINNTLTTESYRQGGLGAGVTNFDAGNLAVRWNQFNSYNPFIPCGYTNSLGNASGERAYVMPFEFDCIPPTFNNIYTAATAYTAGQYVGYNNALYKCILASTGNLPTNATYFTAVTLYKGAYNAGTAYIVDDYISNGVILYRCKLNASAGTAITNTTYFDVVTRTTTNVNSYRGIELPYGHIWKRIEGINIYRTGGIIKCYVKNGVTGFADGTASDYNEVANMPATSNYILDVMGDGNLLPKSIQTATPTGNKAWCDHYYAPSSDGWTTPLSGAAADAGAVAGIACVLGSAAGARANVGFRLCFVP